MKQLILKFKLIFVPFLIITVCIAFVYTILNWLLFVKLEVYNFDDFITSICIPALMTGLAILIWLRPKMKLLNFKKRKSGDPFGGYMMVAWVAAAVPVCIAQSYMVTATGQLTQVDNINQINTVPKTKYYKPAHFYIDKKLVRVKPVFKVTDKGRNFDMYIYAPCPIFDSNHNTQTDINRLRMPAMFPIPLFIVNGKLTIKDQLSQIDKNTVLSITVLKGDAAKAIYGKGAVNGVVLITTGKNANVQHATDSLNANAKYKPVAWFKVKYVKTIANNLSATEKDNEYKAFGKECERDFDNKYIDDFVYLERMGESRDFDGCKQAILTKGGIEEKNIVVLSPVYEPYEARNGNKFEWIFGSMGIGSAVFMIFLLFTPLKDDLTIANKTADDDMFGLKDLKIFIPHDGFYITPIIIDLNLIIFIIMVSAGLGFISFEAPDLLKWGGNLRSSVVDGKQYWRLLTNTFLHGGIMHVLFNMYGLLVVGIFLEPIMGTKRYALAYIGTGILASIASIWWHVNTVSIGASGAIFGMYGIFLALLTTNLFPKDFKKPFLISTSVFVGYNLLYGLTGGIDNAAHIGGLLSGIICGYAMYPMLKNKADKLKAHEETQQFLDDLIKKD